MEEVKIYQGTLVDLAPMTEEDLDFICEEEADENLWKFEESVETNCENIRNKFKSQRNDNYRYDFMIRNKDGNDVGVFYTGLVNESRI